MREKQTFLRQVDKNDAELLYIWRNDAEVRKNSFSEERIEFQTHLNWLGKTLKRKDVLFYILVEDGNNIGQIRLNIENGIGIISYSIDNMYRNDGYGTKMLQLVEETIQKENLDLSGLQGLVKTSNIGSQKAFEKMGYIKEESDYIVYTKMLNK